MTDAIDMTIPSDQAGQTATPMHLQPGNLKAAMAATGSKSRDLWFVPIGDILTIPGFNVRDRDEAYTAHIRAIADSILANGFFAHKPLAGFIEKQGDRNLIRLTDGHSRLEAALLAITEGAAIEKLPFVAHPAGTSMEDLTASLATDNSGKPLKPLALARVCKRLMGYGLEKPEVSRRLSITRTYVDNLMQLLAAPKTVRDMVASGEVSATMAIQTIKSEGVNAAEKLQAASASAKAAGKSKVTARMLKPKPEAPTDKAASGPLPTPKPAPNQPSSGKWMPTEHQLPASHKKVIAWMNDADWVVAFLNADKEWMTWPNGRPLTTPVTHWAAITGPDHA